MLVSSIPVFARTSLKRVNVVLSILISGIDLRGRAIMFERVGHVGLVFRRSEEASDHDRLGAIEIGRATAACERSVCYLNFCTYT